MCLYIIIHRSNVLSVPLRYFLFCQCNGKNKFERILALPWQGDNSTSKPQYGALVQIFAQESGSVLVLSHFEPFGCLVRCSSFSLPLSYPQLPSSGLEMDGKSPQSLELLMFLSIYLLQSLAFVLKLHSGRDTQACKAAH